MSKHESPRKKDIVLTPKGRKFFAGLALTGAFAAGGVVTKTAENVHLGSPEYTKAELDAMPHKTVIVEPFTGVDAAIAKVDGENLSGEEMYELREYVQGQAEGVHNTAMKDGKLVEVSNPYAQLQANQAVEVPILPGHEVPERPQQ